MQSLGLNQNQILDTGVILMNWQMAGLLLGGIIGGILGDKKGRVSILYWSMILYSIGNLANAFVSTVPAYAFCRFITGLGLAGEIGASVAIIIETLPIKFRTYGLMLLIALGHAASLVSTLVVPHFEWRTNFQIGGSLGALLLLMRFKLTEPAVYQVSKSRSTHFGSLRLIAQPKNLIKFLKGFLIGIPNYSIAILTAFAPEIGKAQGISAPILPAVYFSYFTGAMILGDLTSAYLSHHFASRKKIVILFHSIMIASVTLYFCSHELTHLYLGIVGMGFASGQWVLVNTISGEQFGTNIRASITTLTPNLIRASIIVFNFSFLALKGLAGPSHSAMIICFVALTLSLLAAISIDETFGKEIDFVEE